MTAKRFPGIFRSMKAVVGLALAAGFLAGCSGTDVQLNLPGLGTISTSAKAPERKMAARPPLVLPPTADQLPPPQEEKAVVASQEWPDDPDIRAKRKKRLAALKKEKYRREGNFSDYQGVEEFNKNLDWGSRQEGVFTKLYRTFMGQNDEETTE